MIDLKLIKKNIYLYINKFKNRGCNINIKYLSKIDDERKKLKFKLNNSIFNKNKLSKLLYLYKNNSNINNLYKNINNINIKINLLKEKIKNLNYEINNILYEIPNILSNDVPSGKNSKNIDVYYWGEKRKFNFNIKSYITIGKLNNYIDFNSSSKISGKKFIIMKNNFSRIYRALSQFMLDIHIKNHGYEEIYVPLIVNNESLYGSGQLPKFKKDLFYLNNFNNNKLTHALIPTSEVPLVNIMRNTILNENKLPIKFVSNSSCFRSEVGSYGSNSKGLIRLHQFDKVEMVQFVKPNDSFNSLESLTNNAEYILQLLNLHYRKVLLSANNTSFSSCKTYDLEVWFPYENKYIEVSSCSNTSDFQSRRILARYKTLDNKINLIHILNGSGLAIGRTMAALIENYQEKDMNIKIPKILLPYMKDRL
ncbi:serine--tRNA ligase [endosymbiont of Pachyrhynchus infernalis]|uniref:serine--tRNA ligase n=1 Tax=endosymbiont of Pachyrhynchus infernalis TaxID=1971488 RepID=UPI000DC6E805|nr:serine--tRNA ligase [endosymbiont of Pachyrhynchus infernalis]BBA84759.1 serine--tRNA ligase [endosymbiont of Pachyrhynchus infernalis]